MKEKFFQQKNIAETAQDFLKSLADIPVEYFYRLWDYIGELPRRNYEQGAILLDAGKVKDAIARLRLALWLDPEMQEAWYILGAAFTQDGRPENAIKALKRSLQMNPMHRESLYTLAMINPSLVPEDKRPTSVPENMVKAYFAAEADIFDELQKERNYRGHVFVDQAVRSSLDNRRTNHNILDIGCGTGACGDLLSDFTTRLTGVDFTEEMLAIASGKVRESGQLLYEKTYMEDLRDFMNRRNTPEYDAIIAAHVLHYIGDLSSVFDGVAKCLLPEGVFVFQVIPASGDSYYLKQGSGHFAHSELYILNETKRVGLEIVKFESMQIYPELTMVQYTVKMPSPEDED